MNPSLTAQLKIDEKDLLRGLNASEEGFKQAQDKARLLAAEMALLEQRMASGKTDAMVADYKKLDAAFRSTRDEATAMAKQLRALEAVKPPALKLPDESGSYEAWLRRADEQERSRRAHEAMANTRLAMPVASAPSAAVQVMEDAAGAAGKLSISRMGKMELGHVARSLAGSVGAGVPITDALTMEAPRILQALGPALGALLPVIAPLAAAFVGLKLAVDAHKANNAARALRRKNEIIDSQSADSSEQYEQKLEDDEKQVLETREARKKRGFWNKVFGAGNGKRDEILEQGRANVAAIDLKYAVENEQSLKDRQFEGDPNAAFDLLDKERDAKIAAAKDKYRGDDDAAVSARQTLIAKANSEHDREYKKLERERGDQQSDIDAAARDNYQRERGGNMPVVSAVNRAAAAREKLDHGPQLGQEHDENKVRADAARMDAEDAAREDKTRSASIAAEQQILQIKRSGMDVEVQVAEKRLEVARAALESSRQKTGAEYDALQLAVSAGQAEIEAAKKARDERRAGAEIDARIAGLRGSSTQVRGATLDFERADLIRQAGANVMDPAKSAEINAQLARNAQQRAEFDKAERLRAIDIASTEDKAHTGRGPEAQAAFLQREMDRLSERRDWNKNENGNDAGFNAGLDDKLHELTQAIEDLNFTEQAHLTALNKEHTKTQRRGYQPTQGDKDRDADDRADRERATAIHRGASPSELDAIEANRAADHLANAADEAEMTPEQRAARGRANDARDRAVGRVQSGTGKTKAAESGANVQTDDFVADAAARRQKVSVAPVAQAAVAALIPRLIVPNRIDEIKAGAANAGKGDVAAVDNAGIIAAINSPEWAKNFSLKNRA